MLNKLQLSSGKSVARWYEAVEQSSHFVMPVRTMKFSQVGFQI